MFCICGPKRERHRITGKLRGKFSSNENKVGARTENSKRAKNLATIIQKNFLAQEELQKCSSIKAHFNPAKLAELDQIKEQTIALNIRMNTPLVSQDERSAIELNKSIVNIENLKQCEQLALALKQSLEK